MSQHLDASDVVIVGLGPVGSALAILLGQMGHDVTVLERWPTAYPLPRAVHFDDEVARILQSCGIGAVLPDITEPPDIYEWRNAAGDTLLRFGMSGVGTSGWSRGLMFHQPQLEAALAERVASLPNVRVRKSVEFTGVDSDGDGLTVRYRGISVIQDADGRPIVEPTGDEGSVSARYVVGCDGANSSVRDAAQFTLTDLGFFYDWFIVDLVFNEHREFNPTNLQVCDPARPTTVVSGGPGRRRWEFMRLPTESREDFVDESAAWRLLEPWDVTPENARLERHAVYTFQARWVDNWRDGKVLLAGDAAHQMPPFAGQGMCAGIRDAANLAWKLDHVLHGHAPGSLLDLYGIERRPSVQSAIEFSMELGKVICVPDAEAAAARDQAMIPAASDGQLAEIPPLPGIVEGFRLDDDALAGELFTQASVEADGRVALLDDHVGAGWRLLTIDRAVADAIDADIADWFASIGGRTVVIAPDGDVADVDDVYASWFDGAGVSVVLQRPDFYMFGGGSGPDDGARLLAAARDMLAMAAGRQGGNS